MGLPRHLHKPLTIKQQLNQIQKVAVYALADLGAVNLRDNPAGPSIYDLTNINAVTRGAGPSANLPSAANFPGTNQYLTAPVPPPRGSFTVAGWARFVSAVVTDTVIAQWDNTANRVWDLNLVNGAFLFRGSLNGTATAVSASSAVLSIDTWYFIVAWFDSAAQRLKISVNAGVPAVSGAVGGSQLFQGSNPLSLGAESAGGVYSVFFTGLMSAWNYWNRLLTQQEIFTLYNNGQGYPLAPLA